MNLCSRRATVSIRAALTLFALARIGLSSAAKAEAPGHASKTATALENWVVSEGQTTFSWQATPDQAGHKAMGRRGDVAGAPATVPESRSLSLIIAPGSDLVLARDGEELRIVGGTLYHDGSIDIGVGVPRRELRTLSISGDAAGNPGSLLATDAQAPGDEGLRLIGPKVSLDETTGTLVVATDAVELAKSSTGDGAGPRLDPAIESVVIRARLQRSDGGAVPARPSTTGTNPAPSLAAVTAASVGPDITILTLSGVDSYGSAFDPDTQEGIAAFAVGTTSCNIGDEDANWYQHTAMHPIIAGGMYRLKDGRFEQIGMSWVKHGFFAVNSSACGTCDDPFANSQPNDPVGYLLGPNCSDPYQASLNGSQISLGPRSQINAFSGVFPYPPSTPPRQGNRIERRLQVHHDDLEPDLNPGALYFVESEYVSADDAFAGNGQNNCAYRKINFIVPNPDTTDSRCPAHQPHPNPPVVPNIVYFCAIPTGSTQREQPAIRAWKDNDPNNVVETDVFTLEDPATLDPGLLILSGKATELPNGLWHYEYAMENVNSDRSAGSFRITIPSGATLQNIGFHDVSYHSGNLVIENYDGADWVATVTDNTITWSTLLFAVKQNANALRWGTLYNFRFDIAAAPRETTAVIGLFKPKPPLPDQVTVRTVGPSGGIADCNNNGIVDRCDIVCGKDCGPNCGQSDDCDFNGVPDDCEDDCNENGVADLCDVAFGTSADCNGNEMPDECEPDCDHDGVPNVCETILDTDEDGIDDCSDLCRYTSPPGACLCPERDRCCHPNQGICIPDFPREACLDQGGVPDCLASPCRDGCLVGDSDLDGDRDMADFGGFLSCYGSAIGTPAFQQPSQECKTRFDYDSDGDVDLTDYFRWVRELQGPGSGL